MVVKCGFVKDWLVDDSGRFRAVAGGYFGHCWERLSTFWMLVALADWSP